MRAVLGIIKSNYIKGNFCDVGCRYADTSSLKQKLNHLEDTA